MGVQRHRQYSCKVALQDMFDAEKHEKERSRTTGCVLAPQRDCNMERGNIELALHRSSRDLDLVVGGYNGAIAFAIA
jgi:hypothetical protein